jgi:hypothetical protein
MPKLAIVAEIEIQPGRMDEVLPLLIAHRAPCLRDEPGTLQFEVLRPRHDDTKVAATRRAQRRDGRDKIKIGPSLADRGGATEPTRPAPGVETVFAISADPPN